MPDVAEDAPSQVPWRKTFDNARTPYDARVALGVAGSGGFGDAPSDGNFYARQNSAWASLVALLPTTGDLKPTHKAAADAGWILWSDGTIGDASSSSSIRANADTNALFTLYYNSYNDARCPLLTSGGGATTRAAQGTAAAAFAAHCRMTLPKGSGRSLALAGAGSGLTSRTLGDSAGAETETQTIAKMAAHTHTITDPTHTHNLGQNVTIDGGSIAIDPGATANVQLLGIGDISVTQSASTGITATASAGSGTALNILDPSIYINVMIKL